MGFWANLVPSAMDGAFTLPLWEIKDMLRGGARPGAGRKTMEPDEKRRSLTVRLPPWMLARLHASADSAAVMIERALRLAYGWREPPVN